MLGKPAPQTGVAHLGASTATLLPEESKVVLLDFWATWCGPCIVATPAIAAVADDFADRGVRLVAVNVGEDPETVAAFVKQKALSSKQVVMDPDGRVSLLYKVDSFPTVMLVDEDRVVQAVYEGYSGVLHDQVRSDVERLLKGESLVSAPAES